MNSLKVKPAQKIPDLGEVAQIMNGRPEAQKIRVLRNTLMKFLMYVQHNGYTFDEPSRSLCDFFNDHKNGPEAANNLIKTVWVVLNAETIVDVGTKRN